MQYLAHPRYGLILEQESGVIPLGTFAIIKIKTKKKILVDF